MSHRSYLVQRLFEGSPTYVKSHLRQELLSARTISWNSHWIEPVLCRRVIWQKSLVMDKQFHVEDIWQNSYLAERPLIREGIGQKSYWGEQALHWETIWRNFHLAERPFITRMIYSNNHIPDSLVLTLPLLRRKHLQNYMMTYLFNQE